LEKREISELSEIRRLIINKQAQFRRQQKIIDDQFFLEIERQRNREQYKKHRKQNVERSKKWNRAHKDEVNANRRKYRLEHLEQERKQSRVRWQKNRLQTSARRRKSGMGLHIVKAITGKLMYYFNGVRIGKPKE